MELTMREMGELLGAVSGCAVPDVSHTERDHGCSILIADRGFVWVGNVRQASGQHVISRATQIRVWGTTRGLGELVAGPTASTKLDPIGCVRVPDRAVIAIIPVEADKWNSSLP